VKKGRNLIYGDLRLLESMGKINEKERWGESVGFSYFFLRKSFFESSTSPTHARDD
jgi:hypothetical protein